MSARTLRLRPPGGHAGPPLQRPSLKGIKIFVVYRVFILCARQKFGTLCKSVFVGARRAVPVAAYLADAAGHGTPRPEAYNNAVLQAAGRLWREQRIFVVHRGFYLLSRNRSQDANVIYIHYKFC